MKVLSLLIVKMFLAILSVAASENTRMFSEYTYFPPFCLHSLKIVCV